VIATGTYDTQYRRADRFSGSSKTGVGEGKVDPAYNAGVVENIAKVAKGRNALGSRVIRTCVCRRGNYGVGSEQVMRVDGYAGLLPIKVGFHCTKHR
jgi:hypothetical protein